MCCGGRGLVLAALPRLLSVDESLQPLPRPGGRDAGPLRALPGRPGQPAGPGPTRPQSLHCQVSVTLFDIWGALELRQFDIKSEKSELKT